MLKEIAKFIEDNTSFVIGTDLFEGHRLQDAPDQCQIVLETGGGSLHFDLTDRVDKMIQIISRAKTYFTARTDAWEVFDALHNGAYGSAGHTLAAVAPAVQNYEAMTIEAISDPQYIGQDEKRRYEFSCNYLFKIRNA
jgi:hypothetical protein